MAPPSQPNQSPSFRYRTVLEVALIASVIYLFLGAPGLNTSALLKSSTNTKTAAPRPKPDNVVLPDRDLRCPPHAYTTHIYSVHPLIVVIEDFLSESEAEHLLQISEPLWQPSTVFNGGVESHDPNVRNSDKALLPRDTIVQCIEARALAFQGWPASTSIERLWTQRYNTSGHYSSHYDWASAHPSSRRASTFNVYIRAPSSGGGTAFPKLPAPASDSLEQWGRFVEVGDDDDDDDGKGTVFKARDRGAVFWMNFDAEGRGFAETLHAALPVEGGVKVGLNVWSWFHEG